MLLTFTTMAYADDGDYLMTSIADGAASGWMWILDAEQGKVKACWTNYNDSVVDEILCTKWKDLHED